MGTKQFDSATDLITFTRASGGTALRKVSYGSELVTNGDFSNGSTGWLEQGGWTFASGKATNDGTNDWSLQQLNLVTVGKTYRITYDVSDYGSGNISVGFNSGGGSTTVAANGSYEVIETATQTYFKGYPRSSFVGSIDNISVKEVLFDQPDGTLQLFNSPANVPRIEYNADGTVKGLLIEEARTNLLPYSNQANQLSYYSNGITTGVDTTEVSSPQNSGTVIKLNKTATGFGFARVAYSSVTNAQTFSSFVKKGTARYIGFRQLASSGTHTTFDLENNTWVQNSGSTSRGYEDYGNGWLRLWAVSDDSTSKLWASIAITNSQGDEDNSETGTVYIFGLQREQGAFPTSYIPTTGSTATRAADVATIPTANFGYNSDAGTLVVDAQSSSGNTNSMVAALEAVGGINRIEARFSGSLNTNARATVVSNYVTQATLQITGLSEQRKIAFAFASNDFALSANGSAVVSHTSGTLPTVTKMDIGEAIYENSHLNGHIKSIQYYPRRLSNAQLQELTT